MAFLYLYLTFVICKTGMITPTSLPQELRKIVVRLACFGLLSHLSHSISECSELTWACKGPQGCPGQNLGAIQAYQSPSSGIAQTSDRRRTLLCAGAAPSLPALSFQGP